MSRIWRRCAPSGEPRGEDGWPSLAVSQSKYFSRFTTDGRVTFTSYQRSFEERGAIS